MKKLEKKDEEWRIKLLEKEKEWKKVMEKQEKGKTKAEEEREKAENARCSLELALRNAEGLTSLNLTQCEIAIEPLLVWER